MINNALREFKEKDALKSAQRVEDFSSMLEYEDEIINALPYGISAILLVDDDTTGMANVYRNDYAQMIADSSKAFETEAKGMM